ncbi:zinc finger MYND domain-containing protein 12-like [Limulus polyphemus]|uniref:Zinc finger MYND domain-containing protein 12-like n=1 Tax=Limulus polyphemus TaxID=6850 RepID=A0ABM1T1F6_LIMPO|nr:zinc finger MYND domain-containing protein 12-like [Limulus polyphemus]
MTAHKFLLNGKPSLAIPAAMQSLRLGTEVYGDGSAKLVPSFLLLAEASIGVQKLIQAQDYISQGEWVVMRAENSSPQLLSALYRTMGHMYFARNLISSAQYAFAEHIYQCTKSNEDKMTIHCATGCFHLGLVLQKLDNIDGQLALFQKAASMWQQFLMITVRPTQTKDKCSDGLKGKFQNFDLQNSIKDEGLNILLAMKKFCSEQLEQNEEDVKVWKLNFTVHHALALLYFVGDRFQEAKQCCKKGLSAAKKCSKEAKISSEEEQHLQEYLSHLDTISIHSCTTKQ